MKTPYEEWYKKKPNYEHLRIFGCLAYSHIPKERRTKLEDKAERCMMIGYDSNAKAYRLVNLRTLKVVVSRDVIFDETTFPFKEESCDRNMEEEDDMFSITCSVSGKDEKRA